jgi:hypothetical protein
MRSLSRREWAPLPDGAPVADMQRQHYRAAANSPA